MLELKIGIPSVYTEYFLGAESDAGVIISRIRHMHLIMHASCAHDAEDKEFLIVFYKTRIL